MKQKVIVAIDFNVFSAKLQKELDAGWVPVPGTISMTDREQNFKGIVVVTKPDEQPIR
jgi:hypothetical protein